MSTTPIIIEDNGDEAPFAMLVKQADLSEEGWIDFTQKITLVDGSRSFLIDAGFYGEADQIERVQEDYERSLRRINRIIQTLIDARDWLYDSANSLGLEQGNRHSA